MLIPVSDTQDERHLRLLNALPAIAWSASARTFRFTYINPAAETLLGYPSSAWIEEPDFWSRHLHPDDRHVVRLCHTETVACRRHELVYRMIAADGRTVWIRDYVNVHSVDGEAVELFGVMVDITDSVRARQALEASERRYRELVDGVSDILYTVDGEGRFVSLSRSFERSTGYHVEDWIGRPFAELFRAPSTPQADHLRELAGGDAGMIREYELPDRSGAVVTLEVLSQPRYVDGVVAGTIGMARDVTESRNIARKLEEAKRMSSLGQLAASLAHEFNNVLMGIQPFVEVIGRSAAGPHVSDALGHITRAVSRGKRASQEVLRYAKPKEPHFSVIDALVWLPTFLRQLTAALPGSVTLGSSIGTDVPYIRSDTEHLEQVITNLVYNARDAMPAGGAIHVSVSRAEGEFVRISVFDEGPGIAPEMLDRIFEPLFTTKRNGTGLGLAIARRLIERQGGALTAENRPDGGSVFHVFVPMLETATPAMQPAARATPAVTRILLVEDDLSAGAGLEQLLQSEGYETTWVRLAADACAAAHRTDPQVAIIDVNLPDGNGVDLVPLLRAGHALLPIVLSTGHVELNISDVKERILSLMKPYELGELLAAIANVTKAA